MGNSSSIGAGAASPTATAAPTASPVAPAATAPRLEAPRFSFSKAWSDYTFKRRQQERRRLEDEMREKYGITRAEVKKKS